jgi:hypothetical protein
VHPGTARATAKSEALVLAQLDAAARAGDSHSFFDVARRTLLQTFATRWRMPVDQITSEELKARLGTTGEDVGRLFALADETKYAGDSASAPDFRPWLALIRGQLTGESR